MPTNGNFFTDLERRLREHADRPCLRPQRADVWTYGAMDMASAKYAGALRAAGAAPGDRIVAQVRKSPQAVALYLASLRAGLIYVPLNTAYTQDELAYFLNDAEPSVFVGDPGVQTDLKSVAQLTLDADGHGTLAEAAAAATPFGAIEQRDGNDIASILYTSGTTGRSKGAMLSHDNLSSNAHALHGLWGFQRGDVLLHALPIFHIHGLFVALHTALLNGSEVLFHEQFDVTEICAALPDATILMGVPTFYTRLLDHAAFRKDRCANIRLFISGSAPLSTETFAAFEARTGHKILERYGMSEAGMIASNPLKGERLAGTVGHALPGVDVRVTIDGDSAACDETGGVEVRGPNVFQGYWRMPEKTDAEFTEDGWFRTGDVGSLGKDGRLTLSGRTKDLIIVGGYNVYPKEIEILLDSIDGVLESAVIGAPHPDMGEGVVAVLTPENEALDDALLVDAMNGLAKFKRPRRFFWVDALPRNAMGKVQKQLLREEFASTFSEDREK
ncbi:MAG: AMP-binding protein [Pseudomonadota bacterium]